MNNNNTLPFRVQSYSSSEKGRRKNNEDFVTSFEPPDPKERQASGCIYIVADGVGGASIGERASQYASEKVLYEYLQHPEVEPGKRLKQAITRVNREIFDYAESNNIRMATTMAAAVVLQNSLIVANVGDSRVYLIRGEEVRQITRDHTVVGELVRDGAMSEAEAMKSKAKNRLTRSVGGDDTVHVDIFGPIQLQPDDKILLCSDGLTRYAMKEDIGRLAAQVSPKQIVEDAVAFAKQRGRGGADNISVFAIVYEPSSSLEATIQRPRPTDPEQPWEIMETDPGFRKRERGQSQFMPWPILGLVGLVLLAAILLVFLLGRFLPPPALSPTATTTFTETPAPTITHPNPSEPPTLQPSFTPEPPSAPIGKITYCPHVNVRPFPSSSDEIAPRLGTLKCDEIVTITGKFIDSNSTKWYQINYIDFEGNNYLAWLIASSVEVSPVIEMELPIITILTPSQTPQPTVGIDIVSDKVFCVYEIQAGDNPTVIATKFGIGAGNYNKIKCASEPVGCDLNDPEKIQPKWRVIIPDVERDVCTKNGGQIQ